jgi:hypothetical protein
MTLNNGRLYKIRRLVDSIFMIQIMWHLLLAFVHVFMLRLWDRALRKPGAHAGAACLRLHVDVPDRRCVMVACIRVKFSTCTTYIGCLRTHYYTDNITEVLISQSTKI